MIPLIRFSLWRRSACGTILGRCRLLCTPISNFCELLVLGTGSSEFSPFLCLSTGSGRYLFNCPERALLSLACNSIKPSTVNHIFLTKSSWENMGGIFSTLVKMNPESSHSSVATGPCGFTFLRDSLKSFVDFDDATFTPRSDEPTTLKFNDINVTAVELQPSTLCKTVSESIAAYVIQLPTLRGKADKEKAIELGVVSVQDFKALLNGVSVTSINGNAVYPHQVLEPEQVGPQALVLECPDPGFLKDITTHPFLNAPQLKPVVVVHITPKAVLETTLYNQWMKQFHQCQHILLHPDFCPSEIAIKPGLYSSMLLHLVEPNIFNLPTTVSHKKSLSPAFDSPVIIGQCSMAFHIRPLTRFGVDKNFSSKMCSSSIDSVLNDLMLDDQLIDFIEAHPFLKSNFNDLLSNLKNKLLMEYHEKLTKKLFNSSRTKITFLGTGASNLSITRNVSSILLHLPSGAFMLLDAGEGTLSQLYMCFGSTLADEVLRNLKCIFVSHMHNDHHLGVTGILQKIQKLSGSSINDDSVLVVGPRHLSDWLLNYSSKFSSLKFRFIAVDKKEISLPSLHLKMEFVPVCHPTHSHGIILYYKNKWKLVYSGDTRPCRDLVRAGKDASLLIHEATFDDSLQANAVARLHSTKSEAIQVARHMNAAFLMLTHFSQRYHNHMRHHDHSCFSLHLFEDLPSNVAVAYDFMTIDMDELDKLSDVSSTISKIK
ncbi:PREDICTED: zinc phosphodiesterase ELAC protein 2-like [Amphimedon queenslandica]|uniref:ribonuclease Z n=1 Tax=Amphimedon queenslandica TaxID=400682 RepID=A0A1X7V715_AMPQE|nr:PREDICTED: zinc phosphodiesterase ELAC protein 2-like [Amphimedon queenslandica]|eukprot:XP_003385508.2 PREDICTED: zinc phosphodiesterase ELAC protein 2-like [Amphimedon queenslandica]